MDSIKHLDGTICEGRNSTPTKSQIAKYWKDQCYEYFDYLMDWGEPSCWACGKWNEHYDHDAPNSLKEFFSVWNHHKYYLERCHIFPKSHGGCNCEANFVILCRDCHKESPDTKDINLFQMWLETEKAFSFMKAKN